MSIRRKVFDVSFTDAEILRLQQANAENKRTIEELQAKRERLVVEIVNAQCEDTKRLDWLQENHLTLYLCRVDNTLQFGVCNDVRPCLWNPKPAIREAIDTAMKAAEEAKP